MAHVTKEAYTKLVLDSIDGDGYDVDLSNASEAEKVAFAFVTFNREKGYEIKRVGVHQAATDWLQGLASACEVPYTNHDIITWAEAVKGVTMTDEQIESLLDSYFRACGSALYLLFSKHNHITFGA